MNFRGFGFYRGININLGFWWLLSLIITYIVYKIAQNKGWLLIALAAKVYLFLSVGLILLVVIIIVLAIILMLFAFGNVFWKIRTAGKKASRKRNEDEKVIDAKYKVK